MNRISVVVFALLLAACGGSSGGSGSQQQQKQDTSAQSVASSSGDFPGLSRCPESGSWDSYLKAEQTKDPTQYTTDKGDWDGLKAAGANDSYVAVYAESSSACGNFGTDTPTGKAVDIYAVRFKDESSAAANYKASSTDFHLSDSDLQNVTAAGGKVQQGSATGLGANSVAVELALPGTSFYIAFWQNKNFEVAMIVYNLAATDGETAARTVNGRIK
jgi:hypothetical protein